MLFFSRTITDPLESAIIIRRARLMLIGTDNLFSVFVLSRCPARLAHVYKCRASTVLSSSLLIRFFLLHVGFGQQAWYQSTRPTEFICPSRAKICRRPIAAQGTTRLLRLIPSIVTDLLAILTVAPN
jgi:hypothetical protein